MFGEEVAEHFVPRPPTRSLRALPVKLGGCARASSIERVCVRVTYMSFVSLFQSLIAFVVVSHAQMRIDRIGCTSTASSAFAFCACASLINSCLVRTREFHTICIQSLLVLSSRIRLSQCAFVGSVAHSSDRLRIPSIAH
jgi:hypothetical protein